MNTLVAPLENFAIGEKTYLHAEITASETDLSVESVDGFGIGDFIAIGIIGDEITQIRQISDINDLIITLSAGVSFPHPVNTVITRLKYDKRKFYRSSTENGIYSHLSAEGSPIALAVDSTEGTQFDDSTGTSTSWYKATYFNSATLEETPLTDAIAPQPGESAYYTTLYKIRDEAGFKDNDYITSELIGRYRDEAQMEVDGFLAIAYSTPFTSVPKLVTHITTLLAAGLLLAKEYGTEADIEISKTGQRKIERAEELLTKIKTGDILLISPTGAELNKKSTVLMSGSNVYDSNNVGKGQLFNISDENFKFTDPAEPTASSDRLVSNT